MKYLTSKTVFATAVLALSLSVGCSKSDGGGGVVVATPPETTTQECATNPQSCQYNQQYAGYGYYLTSAMGYADTGYQSMSFKTALFSKEDLGNSQNTPYGYGNGGYYHSRKTINMVGQVEIKVNHSGNRYDRYSQNGIYGRPSYQGCPQIIDGTYTISTLEEGEFYDNYRRRRGRRHRPNSNSGNISDLQIRLTNQSSSGHTLDINLDRVRIDSSNGRRHNNDDYYSQSTMSGQAMITAVNGQECYMYLNLDGQNGIYVPHVIDQLFQ